MAAFQTFLYARMFISTENVNGRPVRPGLFLIREMFSGQYNPQFRIGTGRKSEPVEDYSSLDEEFTERLVHLLEDLFDRKNPFQQTGETDHCRICEFRGICHR